MITYIRRAPLTFAALIISMTAITIIDPIRARASWWIDADLDYLVALALPLTAPIAACAVAALLAIAFRSRSLDLGGSLFVLASTSIPLIAWTLLLTERFPGSDGLMVSICIALIGICGLMLHGIAVLGRSMLHLSQRHRLTS